MQKTPFVVFLSSFSLAIVLAVCCVASVRAQDVAQDSPSVQDAPATSVQDATATSAVATSDADLYDETEAAINASIMIGEPEGPPLEGLELAELTDEVTGVMRCPVCQGLSVADSPSKSAVAMKAEARDLLAAGYSGEQVMNYFEQAYGEFVRLEPKAEGFNLVVWIAPGVGFLLGALALALYIRRDRSKQQEAAVEVVEEDPELAAYRERVRQELSREESSE